MSSNKNQGAAPTLTSSNKKLLTTDDFRAEAALKLKKPARDYYNGGSNEELTLARNESAFRRLLIRPRCLRDVSEVDTSVEWYGEKFSSSDVLLICER
ncbi:hypothetical protein ANCDUO_21251 [Ancylostoma duodenale]|uniref:FMN-dependent dehydrogenase domain-containing protein n=1 Tax=Ancylostoma duodenale TaxID=51022 RepID=A0A0C2FUQ9_9BILA|nr:hypothetical protein ANCDUO_21251 [Ancylostoma duodenale]